MSPLENFQEYRKLVRTIEAPTLLCLGKKHLKFFLFVIFQVLIRAEVTLKDILYQCEGSPDVYDERFINLRKLTALGKISLY